MDRLQWLAGMLRRLQREHPEMQELLASLERELAQLLLLRSLLTSKPSSGARDNDLSVDSRMVPIGNAC